VRPEPEGLQRRHLPAIGTIAAYNLNLASLTAANVLGTQTLTRTVTNVGSSSAVYNASASLPGYTVAVTPASLSLAPGAKGQFQVKLTRTTAPANTWVYGALSWSDGTHTVRSPLTARGTTLAVIPLVSSEAATGSKVLTLARASRARSSASSRDWSKPCARRARSARHRRAPPPRPPARLAAARASMRTTW
jgi:hypothetical protein